MNILYSFEILKRLGKCDRCQKSFDATEPHWVDEYINLDDHNHCFMYEIAKQEASRITEVYLEWETKSSTAPIWVKRGVSLPRPPPGYKYILVKAELRL